MFTEGSKTSEFMLIVVAVVCFTVLQALGSLTEEFMLAVAGMVATYTGGRSFVKGKQVEAQRGELLTAEVREWPPPTVVNVGSAPPPPPTS